MPKASSSSTKQSFIEGDLVVLKSGGPDMTIKAVYSDEIFCQWFAGKKLESGRFAPESLKTPDPKP
ncbi:YodC family protein [Citrobacter murliniae]